MHINLLLHQQCTRKYIKRLKLRQKKIQCHVRLSCKKLLEAMKQRLTKALMWRHECGHDTRRASTREIISSNIRYFSDIANTAEHGWF
ncbi:jg3901 [Pararge aegeria aegeria]|uniref:Jg3901 protein n=1 Tax=Pararge aegeria aegeria TaxID=348720 RepID=A0A8S4S0Y0_9NEOP|nr:jg3901 [Pararge aegeria aegeria]